MSNQTTKEIKEAKTLFVQNEIDVILEQYEEHENRMINHHIAYRHIQPDPYEADIMFLKAKADDYIKLRTDIRAMIFKHTELKNDS